MSSAESILSSIENSSRVVALHLARSRTTASPNDRSTPTRQKQDKHKLLGPDFPRTFLTLALGCPGVEKHLQEDKLLVPTGPTIFSADVQSRRVPEKLCTAKVCADLKNYLGRYFEIFAALCCEALGCWQCNNNPLGGI